LKWKQKFAGRKQLRGSQQGRKVCQGERKELIDVTAYLNYDDEKGQKTKSSAKTKKKKAFEEMDERSAIYLWVWGADAPHWMITKADE
jgi:hypothetical protein